MDEAALARALRTGTDGAVVSLIDRYAAELYDYCLTLLPDPEQAADAASSALLAAVDRVSRLAEPYRLRPWLYALARNECLRIRLNGEPARRAPRDDEERLREIHALIHRHGFDDLGVGAVLGVPARRARALAHRVDPVSAAGRAPEPVPAGLAERVLADAEVPARTAYRGHIAGPLTRSGFPVPLDRAGHERRSMIVAGVVAGLLVVGSLLTLPLSAGVEKFDAGDSRFREPVDDDVPLPLPDPSRSSASPSAPPPTPSPTRTTASRSRTPAPRPAPSRSSARPAPPPAPRRPAVPTGPIIGIRGGCLTATSRGVDLLGCNGGAAQVWTLPGDGTVRTLGQCLDIEGGRTEDRTPVIVDWCDGTSAQRWRTGPDAALLNELSDSCLDGPNIPENDPKLEIWHCTGGEYQSWRLPN